MKKLAFILFLILANNLLLASTDVILEDAFSAYQNQDYQQALKLFLQIENEGFIDADLYYNIGNSYYRNNQLGQAILYMKKSLKLDTSHEKAKRGLEFLLNQTRNKQSLEAENLLLKFFNNLRDSISLNWLAIFSLILIGLIILTIHIIIHRYSNRERAVPYLFITILIAILILVLALSKIKYDQRYQIKEAVVLADTAIGYSGPSPDFTRVFTIHEGLILEIEQEQDNWSLVKLPNGIGGWITSDSLEKVSVR